ncbi:anthranilate synthase component I family protein [Paenibacillus sp.]|uniref:anthranilate synthase component I family protein n=1 Tax=Paenibacillus sp. TaxID=58172 RepID=UPI00281176FD|nr:anthranilate synthase component I family protein [Paenibacillus sp.]
MITYGQWVDWNERYNCLPYIEAFDYTASPVRSWERLWEEAGEAAVVLESGKAGRYTFVGAEPAEWVTGGLTEAVRRKASGGPSDGERLIGPPLQILRRWMAEFASPPVPRAPKFTGGIVGYLAYDVVRTIERLPDEAAADSPVPDYFFMRLEKLWIIDHVDQRLYCAAYKTRLQDERRDGEALRAHYEEARAAVAEMKRAWDRWTQAEAPPLDIPEALDIDVERMADVRLSLPKERYMNAVERIREYIASGDVFQVNISVRQSKPLRASPERVFEALRRLNPSPYMAFLRLPGGERIVSGSPELLVRLEHGRLSTRPIAGTRPRGRDVGEDGALREELLLSEKERAEHIMLVDLERNDLGKISTFGTVRVKELMAVEHYSHVMHIVSEVEGELAEGRDAFDCIAAVFPGGTITGAPKVRTMEIIEELEPVRRGVYTGAVGWIDYNGNMELNITIRTLVYKDGTAHVQSGAGIVIDSVPEKEFAESLNKAKALWKAVEISERA